MGGEREGGKEGREERRKEGAKDRILGKFRTSRSGVEEEGLSRRTWARDWSI